MAEEKKRSIIPFIAMVIPALAGLVLGYYIWGAGKHGKIDYKQVLQETVNYISSLEQKNESLTSEVGALQSEVNSLRQQGQQTSSTSSTINSLSRRVQSLESENQRLENTIQRIESFAQGDPVLREKIQGIVQQGGTGTASGNPPQGDGAVQRIR